MLNIPRPPYSMLGYNRTITRTNIDVLINIGPGAGGGRKRRGKMGNLLTLLTMIVASTYCFDEALKEAQNNLIKVIKYLQKPIRG